ncbi:GNAT family N-acetyltransferase [Hymenobacter armeniacus]|uniref:GNAT family N-acetyltransferase n=1 Tax=Hymenobacter armeniacus TaxID=2771358 RepID=A0ABR8JVF3_9BACT|nr:GNAT family N-acetyltransferase [Hymenobacter armeniacus]MBD2722763.1 GNAT family N-acetyltransferase [Hymenobacter armeniacus]
MPPPFSLQPSLETDTLQLLPLQPADFAALYAVAADPAIWAQHPNRDRWQQPVFATFFEGALRSGGAFKVVAKATGAVLGSTRIYDYQREDNSIFIGYTFYGTRHWGKGINSAVKALLLNYLFQFVETVRFHIGAGNVRSQVAIQRLGATKVAEQEVAYFGESPKLNFVYEIIKSSWTQRNQPTVPTPQPSIC